VTYLRRSLLVFIVVAAFGLFIAFAGASAFSPAKHSRTTAYTCFGLPADRVGTSSADTIVGDSGRDVIVGLGNWDGPDLLYGRDPRYAYDDVGDYICGNDDSDEIFGQGGWDHIHGDGGDDILKGGPGNDAINGGPGNDSIDGGAGNDSCWGGTGQDTFTSCEEVHQD
jgi:Ca2+-binding RTX toxin-like protein